MAKSETLLIGSCAGLTGYYLSKIFSLHRELTLLGIDQDANSEFNERFHKIDPCPSSKESEQFINFLTNYIRQNNVDYYLPTHSLETALVSQYKSYLEETTSVRIILSPHKTYLALDDKINANKNLSNIGIAVPRIIEPHPEVVFPIFVKPSVGSGSKGTTIIEDNVDLEYFQNKYSANIFMEYLEGKEFTVDAIFDIEGSLISYNQRERIKTLGGAVTVSINNFEDYDSLNEILKISKHYHMSGVVNFQFILNDGTAFFTDINLRYASGGLPLSVRSGMDVSQILLQLLRNEPVDKNKYRSDRLRRKMKRYFSEEFTIE